jgi:hypothetical protein
MKMQGYYQFVEAFERLTPYELEHFSRALFESFTKLQAKSENSTIIRQDDLRDVMTQAMQSAHIGIAEKKIEEATLNFDLVRSRLLVNK